MAQRGFSGKGIANGDMYFRTRTDAISAVDLHGLRTPDR